MLFEIVPGYNNKCEPRELERKIQSIDLKSNLIDRNKHARQIVAPKSNGSSVKGLLFLPLLKPRPSFLFTYVLPTELPSIKRQMLRKQAQQFKHNILLNLRI